MPIFDQIGAAAPNEKQSVPVDLFQSALKQYGEFADRLLDDIKFLREENSKLTNLLFKKENLQEQEIRTEIPEELTKIGKIPWNVQQRELERSFRKPKLSEISGIPDEVDQEIKEDV